MPQFCCSVLILPNTQPCCTHVGPQVAGERVSVCLHAAELLQVCVMHERFANCERRGAEAHAPVGDTRFGVQGAVCSPAHQLVIAPPNPSPSSAPLASACPPSPQPPPSCNETNCFPAAPPAIARHRLAPPTGRARPRRVRQKRQASPAA